MRKTWRAHVHRQEGGLSSQPPFVLFYDVKLNSFFTQTWASIHLFIMSKLFRECIHIFSQHKISFVNFFWMNTFISMQNSKCKVIGFRALANILNDDCDVHNTVMKLCLYYFPNSLINKCAYKAMCYLRDVINRENTLLFSFIDKAGQETATQQSCPYLKSPSCHFMTLNGRDVHMNGPNEQGVYVYRPSDYFFCN